MSQMPTVIPGRLSAPSDDFGRSKDRPHLATWQGFRRCDGVNGSVGVWRKTCAVEPSSYERGCANMPVSAINLCASARRLGAGRAFEIVEINP